MNKAKNIVLDVHQATISVFVAKRGCGKDSRHLTVLLSVGGGVVRCPRMRSRTHIKKHFP
jgi:hypothetical protein